MKILHTKCSNRFEWFPIVFVSGSDRIWPLLDASSSQVSSALIYHIQRQLMDRPDVSITVTEIASNACMGMMFHPVRFAAEVLYTFPAKISVSQVDLVVGHPSNTPRSHRLWTDRESSAHSADGFDDVSSTERDLAEYQLDKLYFADHRNPSSSSSVSKSSSVTSSSFDDVQQSTAVGNDDDDDSSSPSSASSESASPMRGASAASVTVRPNYEDVLNALQGTAVEALETINLARTIQHKLTAVTVLMELVSTNSLNFGHCILVVGHHPYDCLHSFWLSGVRSRWFGC